MRSISLHSEIQKLTRFFLPILASIMALAPVSPLNRPLSGRDSGVFLYTGWRILNGEVPYRDVWDHKPPMIYFIDALGLLLFPDSTWGVWILEFAFLVAACYLSFKLFERNFGFFPAIAGIYFWVMSFFVTFNGGNLTTEYTLPFQFALLYLFQKNLEKTSVWKHYWLGVLVSLSFFTRQNSIAIGLAIIIYFFIDAIKFRNWRKLVAQYFQLFVGAGSVAVPIILYFALNQALWDFWDAGFLYNFYYSAERTNVDRLNAILRGIEWLSQTGLSQFALLGSVLCSIALLKKRELDVTKKNFLWLALLIMPIEIFFTSLSGRPRIPYYLAACRRKRCRETW